MLRQHIKTHQLAQAARVSVQAVRDYEVGGLLPAVPRLSNGYRTYTARHLAALQTIRALIDAGYTRGEMSAIMNAIHAGSVHHALAIVDQHHADLDDRRRRMLSLESEVLHNVNADQQHIPDIPPQRIPIGSAAALVGVRPSTIRFWESLGLLAIERNASSGFREFGPSDLHRLHAIRQMRALHCSWDTIRSTLGEWKPASRPDTSVASARHVSELDHASYLNARATALVWSYARVTDDSDTQMVEAMFCG